MRSPLAMNTAQGLVQDFVLKWKRREAADSSGGGATAEAAEREASLATLGGGGGLELRGVGEATLLVAEQARSAAPGLR